jgi:hypothetical protein
MRLDSGFDGRSMSSLHSFCSESVPNSAATSRSILCYSPANPTYVEPEAAQPALPTVLPIALVMFILLVLPIFYLIF